MRAKDEIVPHADIVSLLPYFRGTSRAMARIPSRKSVQKNVSNMAELKAIALADLPPPGALRPQPQLAGARSRVVLRSPLEKRRAGSAGARSLTYLHGKMPARRPAHPLVSRLSCCYNKIHHARRTTRPSRSAPAASAAAWPAQARAGTRRGA